MAHYRGLMVSFAEGMVGDPFERTIRRTLRQLSRQRVRIVLQPGNIFVIEYAVGHDEGTDVALRTCWLRGWAEPVEHAIPSGQLTPDGQLPDRLFTGTSMIYRLTDSGWSVVHRSHMWLLMTVLIGLLSLFVALFASGILTFRHEGAGSPLGVAGASSAVCEHTVQSTFKEIAQPEILDAGRRPMSRNGASRRGGPKTHAFH